MADARNFLLSTDYPIDKIIGSQTGSITQAATSSGTTTIAHGLPFAPLAIAKWSISSNFSTSYDEIGVSILNNVTFTAQTDGTNLYIISGNNGGSAVTIYYRVLYFLPADSTATVGATSSSFDDFFLNTDYNYTKIVAEGTVNGGTQVITHSLGYYPQAEVWYKRTSDGRIIHLVENEAITLPGLPTAQMTTTSLTIAENSTPVTNYYYKIYADAT